MNKLIKKLVMSALLLAMMASANANINVWHSGAGSPQSSIHIEDNKVVSKVANSVTTVVLQQVNNQLWTDYGSDYIKTRDFNKDGSIDIAVLSGASLGGSMLCYAVFEYNTASQAYNATSSFSWCK
ncbi:MAG: hypothetical protein KAH22_05705 [Thiotrichaceae bacterium]|nr:hypothetical protein [Thiotrichaceae bacterium]